MSNKRPEVHFTSKLHSLLTSSDKPLVLEEAINALEECIDNYATLTNPTCINAVQQLGTIIEGSTTSAELQTVEKFMGKALPFLLDNIPPLECRSKQEYYTCLEQCICRRIVSSVLFTLLNNMARGSRKSAETAILNKYGNIVRRGSDKLLTNLDFEEKISIVELLWRGIRRVGNAKAIKAISSSASLPLKGIRQLSADNFERDAISWLRSMGCLNESQGYYKVKGKLEVNLTETHNIVEHDVSEIILSPSMLRIHIYRSEDASCLKMEMPYSHMATISMNIDCLDVVFRFTEAGFNIAGLWSAPLQDEVSTVIGTEEALKIKICFVDPVHPELLTSVIAIGNIVNSDNVEKEEYMMQELSLPDEEPISVLDSDEKGECDMDHEKLTVIPASLMFSNRRKAEAFLPGNDSVTTSDYKVMGKIGKGMELDTSPSSIGYDPASVSLSTEVSNSISSCEKPFTENLMAASHGAMQLREHSAEPLMVENHMNVKYMLQTSLNYYREIKAKEMYTIFKRIYKEEMEHSIAEISKLSAAQNARRKELHGSYKREVDTIVREIEHNHQSLADQIKRLLSEFETLKNNTVMREMKRSGMNASSEGTNPLMSKCNELVQSTEAAMKDIDSVVQRIRKQYVRKKQDCSRALEGLYRSKTANNE
ncbi:hypothetical protein BgAZ_300540 [Babesia gibsoni]|uniref:Uncharacterized protein n=1 Tax=Babesia gibsoni TaxID=33632 RepID=A0AAD8LNX3_BABGI|nr:hypothetical protein BgAZ_300540 [Babesia gibsoni]